MKFRIQCENLLQGLGRIQAIIERRGTLPILANVLIQTQADGITLAATDLEVGVVSTHPAEIEQNKPTEIMPVARIPIRISILPVERKFLIMHTPPVKNQIFVW